MIKPALYYLAQELSVIPCREKRPVLSAWKQYQAELMDEGRAREAFASADQIAVICGAVSGGLEAIDFDLKHLDKDLQVVFWDEFQSALLDLMPDVLRRVQINRTASGGYHILYRCEEIQGNKKLAKIRVGERYETVIETRGEGGYVIAPPSDGYEFVKGQMTDIPVLSIEQREQLLALCRSFDQEPEMADTPVKARRTVSAEYKQSPIDHYNQTSDVLQVLEAHGWKATKTQGSRIFFKRPGSENAYAANWHNDKRIFYNFSPNGQPFDQDKGYNAAGVFCLLECAGDWKECFKRLLAAGYGYQWSEQERGLIEMVRERSAKNADPDAIRKAVRRQAPDWMDEDIDRIIRVAQETTPSEGLFWEWNKKGDIEINTLRFAAFLSDQLGYYLHQDSKEAKRPIVRIREEVRQVERVTVIGDIKNEVRRWIRENVSEEEDGVKPDELIEALMNKTDKLFNEKMYEWLTPIGFTTFKDTQDSGYFFFRNGMVKVTRESITLVPYTELPAGTYIWSDRVRNGDFDIQILDEIEMLKTDEMSEKDIYLESMWYRFVRRISGVLPEDDDKAFCELAPEAITRMVSNMTAMGYLLHAYKDKMRPWLLIIQEDTAMDGQGGGSGKQIIYEAIGKLRNVENEDGKLMNFQDRFVFQGVTEDMDVFVIDDVKKGFRLEPLYKLITNDMNKEVRNVGRIRIKYEDSPKWVVITNFDVSPQAKESSHFERRVRRMLVTCYFNHQNTPEKELGLLMDPDWQREQWLMFYNFMFRCLAFYLKYSIVETQPTEATIEKALRLEFGDDFYQFMQDLVEEDTGGWLPAIWLHEQFSSEYQITDKRSFDYRRFRRGFERYCERKGIYYETDRAYRDQSQEARDRFGKIVDRKLAYRLQIDRKGREGQENQVEPGESAPFSVF